MLTWNTCNSTSMLASKQLALHFALRLLFIFVCSHFSVFILFFSIHSQLTCFFSFVGAVGVEYCQPPRLDLMR